MPKDTFSMEPCFETLRGVLGDAAECNAFLVWRLYPRDDGGADKTPVDPASGRKTTPNAAKDRGILTLDEAEAAWRVLRDSGLPVGVGLFPPHTNGMVNAGDLDDVINADGTVAAWTTGQPGYALSQRHRKKIEEPFGWAKTVGGMAQRFV